ncbi:MAG TPA: hypothetical protein VFM71_04540 [Gemmatimonadaceae bacterium]|nr:hypothetical protein [Gemmatimonadaceae bacterium]
MSGVREYVESPVVFGRHHSLVGTVCRPSAALSPKPFVIFLNAGIVHRAGPHRMSVRLARALAEAGVSSLRFDLSGIGDSVIPADAAPMGVQERVQADIDDALEFARDHCHATSFIMGGLCSGADNALRTAARRRAVVGVFLLDLTVARTPGYYARFYLRRLFSGRTWVNLLTGRHPALRRLLLRRSSTEAADQRVDGAIEADAVVPHPVMREYLHRILARDVKLLCIFTAGLEQQYNYEQQFVRLFPRLDFGSRLDLHYFADSDHTFTGAALQERLRRRLVTWVSETEFRDPGERLGRPGMGHALSPGRASASVAPAADKLRTRPSPVGERRGGRDPRSAETGRLLTGVPRAGDRRRRSRDASRLAESAMPAGRLVRYSMTPRSRLRLLRSQPRAGQPGNDTDH